MRTQELKELQELLVQNGTITPFQTEECWVDMNHIFVQDGVYAMSSNKLEGLKRIAAMQRYYQQNPLKFIGSDVLGFELLDAQAWIIQNAWTCPNVLLVCSRGFGKSTIIDLMVMAKDMLFNNYWTYLCSGSLLPHPMET